MPATNHFANKVLDHVMGKGDYTPPSPVYLGIFSTSISPLGIGTEIIGNGYTRIETGPVHWTTSDTGQMRNVVPFTFGPATADWGNVYALALIGPGNNVLLWQKINTAPFRINEGQSLLVSANEITLSLD